MIWEQYSRYVLGSKKKSKIGRDPILSPTQKNIRNSYWYIYKVLSIQDEAHIWRLFHRMYEDWSHIYISNSNSIQSFITGFYV